MLRKYITTAVAVTGLLAITFLFMAKSLKTWQENSWATTTGRIISSDITKSITKSTVSEMSEQRYCPAITYSYAVKDKTYESAIIDDTEEIMTFLNRQEGLKFVRQYPIGKEITVYYKKYNPQISALKITTTERPTRIAISTVLFILAVYISISALSSDKTKNDSVKSKT